MSSQTMSRVLPILLLRPSSSRRRLLRPLRPFSTTPVPQKQPPPPGTYAWRDLPYHYPLSPLPPHPKHHLDIIISSSGPFPRPAQPVLVFVHGGLWIRGDRQHPSKPELYENVGVACARAGVVGVIISYRLVPDVLVFDQIQDVKTAVKWVVREVGKYGGDSRKVFLGGVSAGAHLCAALLASEEDEKGREGGNEGQVRGLVALSGVYNVERLTRLGGGEGAIDGLSPLMVPVFGGDESKWPLASPVHLLRRARKKRRKKGEREVGVPLEKVPVLLVNAEMDFHLEEDAVELVEELEGGREGGREGALVIERKRVVVPGTDHISLVQEMGRKEGGREGGREGRTVLEGHVFDFIHRHSQ